MTRKNRRRKAFTIVELLVVDGPDEGPHGDADEEQTQGNQDDDDAHDEVRTLASRSAFATTRSELADIPMAAM